jgi:hypothetical protein
MSIDMSFEISLGSESMHVNNNKDDTTLTATARLFTSAVFDFAHVILQLWATLAKSNSIHSYNSQSKNMTNIYLNRRFRS